MGESERASEQQRGKQQYDNIKWISCHVTQMCQGIKNESRSRRHCQQQQLLLSLPVVAVAVVVVGLLLVVVAIGVATALVVVAVVPLACCSTLKCEKCVHYLPHNFSTPLSPFLYRSFSLSLFLSLSLLLPFSLSLSLTRHFHSLGAMKIIFISLCCACLPKS